MILCKDVVDDDNPLWATSISEQHDDVEQNRLIRKLKQSEKLIQFLAVFSFSLFLGLFIIQANMAWQSYQMLQQLSKGDVPEMVYSLYFDYLEAGVDPNHVDLRANTSIFVH